MEDSRKTVSVQTTVDAPVEKVWKTWVTPEDIMEWNNASDDWHTPRVENDLRVGHQFTARMEAKDGSFGFDFAGTYKEIILNKRIVYVIEDGRKVEIDFEEKGNQTTVTETFETEDENSIELQRTGWQAIMDNFKKYTESGD